MDNRKNEYNLEELSNSKYEVNEGEADIRGWTVKNGQGKILGQVNDLLFDTELEKVKFVLLDLSDNELHLAERRVMLPIELAKLDIASSNVIFQGIMANELSSIPTYEKGNMANCDPLIYADIFPKNNYASNYSESMAGNANTAYQARQTVIGVFDYTDPAQSAVEYLTEHGFNRSDITIISGNRTAIRNQENDTEKSGFLSSLVNNENEEDAKPQHACVVRVHTDSKEEAEEAAKILDNYGALNMDNRIHQHYNPVSDNAESIYNSTLTNRNRSL